MWDVFHEATSPDGKPLRRLSLRQVLLAQPGVGPAQVRQILLRMFDHLGTEVERPTVQWLIDSRTRGRRIRALHDATRDPQQGPPWHGFPYAPPPETTRESPQRARE